MSGFYRGQWLPTGVEMPLWLNWCGRCRVVTARHTHLNPTRTDREARLQVIYTGVGT